MWDFLIPCQLHLTYVLQDLLCYEDDGQDASSAECEVISLHIPLNTKSSLHWQLFFVQVQCSNFICLILFREQYGTEATLCARLSELLI